ncbi:SH3 domain-containing protein [Bacillus cereus]|uniref:SH3 domain-containing protein n=1 Tax=Bacillus cereus TaxID=1396 RepID=UPI003BF716F0
MNVSLSELEQVQVCHPVVSVMNKGQVVQVVGEVQDWYRVKLNEGFAYINKDYVSRGTNNTANLPQSIQTESVQQNGTYIVDAAVLRVQQVPQTIILLSEES